MSLLLGSAGEIGRTRLLASSSTHSDSWLQALLSTNLRLRLGNSELRLAVDFRLSVPLVLRHRCVCGTQMSTDGTHGLSCRRSAVRHSRHSAINDILAKAFRCADVPVALEPQSMLRGDVMRPDGVTLVPGNHGRCLLRDFTRADTVHQSHLSKTSIAADGAVLSAESREQTIWHTFSHLWQWIP